MTITLAILAIAYSSTITLGAVIVAIATGIAALTVFGYGVRWKTNYEVEKESSRSLGEGREIFKLRTERLEGELKACKEELIALQETRSLEPLLQAILEGFQHMEERLSQHEDRAQERHEANLKQDDRHLNVLNLIADRLGPDGNGH